MRRSDWGATSPIFYVDPHRSKVEAWPPKPSIRFLTSRRMRRFEEMARAIDAQMGRVDARVRAMTAVAEAPARAYAQLMDAIQAEVERRERLVNLVHRAASRRYALEKIVAEASRNA